MRVLLLMRGAMGNATKKRYCIRHKKSNKYPTGTEIVTEDINGVNIKEEWEKIQNGND